MTDTSKIYWFKRRRYGWGWIPVTWQGWSCLVLTLAAVLVAAFVLLPAKPAQPTAGQLAAFFGVAVGAIILLIVVSYRKGPAPRWRWGKATNDNPDEDF